MERGDIYLVSLDPTSGHEQQGRRPVLIVSPAAFNRLTKTPVVLPITSRGNFVRTAGFYADHDFTAHARHSWTPRSGFVQPAFRSVIVESFLCISCLSKGNYIRSTTPEGKA